MVAYNENSDFQVFYHMKLLRNTVPKFPLLEVSQDILKLAIFFSWTFISVGFFPKAIYCSSTGLSIKIKVLI